MKVGNMRRLIIITGILMMILGSVSGCTPQLSDQQIKEDIIAISEFNVAKIVEDQTTLSKKKDENNYHVDVSATLEYSKNSNPYSILVALSMDYSLENNKWNLTKHSSIIKKITPNNLPKLESVVQSIEDTLKTVPGDFSTFSVFFVPRNAFEIISTTPQSDPTKVEMIIEAVLEDGTYSESAQFTLDCQFDRFLGWSYSIKDWEYRESMNWAGTYDLVFTVDEPGFPSNYLNQFYDVGDEIKGMIIQGTSSLFKKMNEPRIVNSDIKVSFSFKGENYLVDAVNDGSPHRLWIKIIGDPDRTHYEDSDIILYYIMKDYSGQGNDGKYHLEALCMYGEITKRP